MTVTVQLFSFLRSLAGRNELPLELPPGATVADVLARLRQQFPRLREAETTMLVAIGVEFARPTDPVRDGDVISLMPPLQGGSDPPANEWQITDRPIGEPEAAPAPGDGGVGGIVVFWGVVRDRESGQPIAALDYTAYRAMAEHQLQALIAETRRRWPIRRLRVVHRLGTIPVGEPSLLVRVEAAHRAEAFAAAQFLIDELKARVPIWKQAVGGRR